MTFCCFINYNLFFLADADPENNATITTLPLSTRECIPNQTKPKLFLLIWHQKFYQLWDREFPDYEDIHCASRSATVQPVVPQLLSRRCWIYSAHWQFAKMFSALKKLVGSEPGQIREKPIPAGLQSMNQSLQRRFAKGVQYNSKWCY